jgi:hypothetical protein
MPWRCPQCAEEIDDDVIATCPGCGLAKRAWTLVTGQTRTLRVGKRFICERGDDDAPSSAPLPAAYDAATWLLTGGVAPALPTSEARRLAEAGQGPAPRDVLRVSQKPGKGKPTVVELTTLPEGSASRTIEREARPEPPHDARFLLVFGEPPDGLAFEGLEVVDVTDDRPEGHAPHIEVVALKRPPQRLAITPADAIDWSLFTLDVGDEEDQIDWGLFSFDVGQDEVEDEVEVDWGLFSFDVATAHEAD